MTSGSSVWITCSPDTIMKNSDAYKTSSRSYELSNSLVQLPDKRKNYCVCSFMKCIYVVGGRFTYQSKKTCLKYTTIDSKWKSIANLNNSRTFASCTVFEGKIVVSGGVLNRHKRFKSVEAYDHHENKWTYLPDMINERSGHGSISMGNKMFVIGGKLNKTCEVFDSTSSKFTAIKIIKGISMFYVVRMSLVSIGNKTLFFPKLNAPSKSEKFHSYDVLKDQWFVKKFDFFEVQSVISCSNFSLV